MVGSLLQIKIIDQSLVRVTPELIGGVDLLPSNRGVRSLIQIRMILASKPAIGGVDLVLSCVLSNSQRLIVRFWCHRMLGGKQIGRWMMAALNIDNRAAHRQSKCPNRRRPTNWLTLHSHSAQCQVRRSNGAITMSDPAALDLRVYHARRHTAQRVYNGLRPLG